MRVCSGSPQYNLFHNPKIRNLYLWNNFQTKASCNFTSTFMLGMLKIYFCDCISPAVSGTVRAVVSENSDDSNHAFGMSLMSTAITSGFIFGPAVAGTTSDPIRQYNLTINSEFTSTRER